MPSSSAASDVQGSWLAVLVRGGSLEEIEALRADAIANAHDATARADIEAEARLAIHLHTLLTERKTQADELKVLNDLARQLSTLRQPMEVLDDVALQARRLLAVDFAYVMLEGPDGVLHVEVVNGSVGAELWGSEVPRGLGLGGRVLSSGAPYWSEDLLRDMAVQRTAWMDEVIVSERIGGLLGVPLRVGLQTIGVLCAADHAPRRFSEHDISLLSSLGDHAAMAIHNARLFDESQRLADELRRRGETHAQAVDLHQRLTHVLLDGGGVREVTTALSDILGMDVVVVDPHDTVIAASTEHGNPGRVVVSAAEAIGNRAPLAGLFRSGNDRSRARRGTVVRGDWIASPVLLADECVGVLVVRANARVDESTRLIEAGSTLVGLVIASDRAVQEAERRTRGEFVTALFGGQLDEATVHRRAHLTGIDLTAVRTIAVLDQDHGEPGQSIQVSTHLAREWDGLAGEYGSTSVVLLPGAEPETVRDRLQARRPGDEAVTVGLARCDGTLLDLQRAYRSALDTTRLLHALGRSGVCGIAEEVGIYASVFSHSGRDEVARFIDLTVGPVVAYDGQHGTDLAETLETYLAEGRSHADTARLLHVHTNTLYKRLARIDDVLGEAWRKPGRALDVQLALRLRRLTVTFAGASVNRCHGEAP